MKIKLFVFLMVAGSAFAAHAQTSTSSTPAPTSTTGATEQLTEQTTAQKTMAAARTSPIGVGDLAPDFTLKDTAGRDVKLSAARGKSPVVLVFYRGYWCPFCAHQLGDLRSLLKAGKDKKVRLYAVSIDAPETSKEFAGKIASDGKGALNFSLLSDPEHRTIDAYGLLDPAYVGQRFEGVPHPTVYVIDRDGRVAWAKIEPDYKLRPSNQDIRAALAAVKK